MTPNEQLKARLKASQAGLEPEMFPENFTFKEYKKTINDMLDKKETPRQAEIEAVWQKVDDANDLTRAQVDKSILRNQQKFKKPQTETIEKALERKSARELPQLAKAHGHAMAVGVDDLKGQTAKKILAAPGLVKGLGAFAGGVMATNLLNDALFDEPLPTPVVMLEAAGVSYIGYKAALPALQKQASGYARKAATVEKTEAIMKAKAATPKAFQELMDKSEVISSTRLADRQIGNINKMGKAVKGAGLFIAGTSILHQLNKGLDASKGRGQIKDQEKRQKEKLKEESKKREQYRTGVSFGHVDTSTIVMDLFNERIGHHKMGNSRF